MSWFKRNCANLVTCIRLLGCIALIFLKVPELAFYIVYTCCGVTDAIDGMLARGLKITSSFGSFLDTLADLSFYTVMIIKIFPWLWELPLSFWIIFISAITIRLLAYALAALKFKVFSSVHTYLNKITGLLVFAAPYFILTPYFALYCFITISVAAFSSLEEFLIHVFSKVYSRRNKSLLFVLFGFKKNEESQNEQQE